MALGLALPLLVVALTFQTSSPERQNPVSEGFDLIGAERTATRFLTAFESGDETSMESAALDENGPDPFLVIDDLLLRHARATLDHESTKDESRFLDAAFEFALLTEEMPAAEGLYDFVELYSTMEPSELERERELQELARQITTAERLPGEDDADSIQAVLSRSEDSRTVAVVILRIEAAAALRPTMQFGRAIGHLDLASAETVGWPTGRALALRRMSELSAIRGSGQSDELQRLHRNLERAQGQSSLGAEASALFLLGWHHIPRREFHRAGEYFERSLELYNRTGNRRGIVDATRGLAAVHDELGEHDRALEEFEFVLRESEAVGDRPGALKARMSLGLVHRNLGEYPRALVLAERVFRDAQELDSSPEILANLLGDLGSLHDIMGHHLQGAEYLRRALQAAEASGDSFQVSRIQGNLGLTLTYLGRFDEALDLLRAALEAKRSGGNRSGAAITLGAISHLYSKMGRYADALTTMEQALAEQELAGGRREVAECKEFLGILYRGVGFPEEARTYLQEAVRAFEEIGEQSAQLSALATLAAVQYELGEKTLAYETLEIAYREAVAINAQGDVRRILNEQAGLYWQDGNTERALECCERALESYREAGDLIGHASVLGNLGLILRDAGRADEAAEKLKQALENLRQIGAEDHGYKIAYSLGMLQYELGNSAEALETARRTTKMLLRASRGLGDAEVSPFRVHSRDVTDMGLFSLFDLVWSSERTAAEVTDEVFWFVESGRALSLLERISNRETLLDVHVDPPVMESYRSVRQAVRAAEEKVAQISGPSDEAWQEAEEELDRLYRDLEAAFSRIQRTAPRVADVVAPDPAGFAEVQERLPPDGALVLFHFAPPLAMAIVVTPEGSEFCELKPFEEKPCAEIRDKAERYLTFAANADSKDEKLAADLYDTLLRPLEAHLLDVSKLFVSPDEILTLLPFEALLRRDPEGNQRAVERWEITYVPSGSVYRRLDRALKEQQSGQGLIALGDPIYPGEREHLRDLATVEDSAAVSTPALRDADLRGLGDLRRLPETEKEVQAIGQLFAADQRSLLLRELASVSSLKSALEQHPARLAALHFACHGHIDGEHPNLSGLVLAEGRVLGLDEIQRLRIPADLVVLSACETGEGAWQRGEGVQGLVRAFFFAGAQRVVVSNWPVDDESTRAFMVAFYEQMKTHGRSPSSALRAAKLEQIKAGTHPYHWAPFVLWGGN